MLQLIHCRRAASAVEFSLTLPIFLAVIFGTVVFGGYLAMAGHRSHLYQSNNALAAWLASVLSQRRSEPSASEPSEGIKEIR